jgi:hypothetical protein
MLWGRCKTMVLQQAAIWCCLDWRAVTLGVMVGLIPSQRKNPGFLAASFLHLPKRNLHERYSPHRLVGDLWLLYGLALGPMANFSRPKGHIFPRPTREG